MYDVFYLNKTFKNLFSPYPRSQSNIKLYTYKAQNSKFLLVAGKACNKLPAFHNFDQRFLKFMTWEATKAPCQKLY
jgi:hypothetical protein